MNVLAMGTRLSDIQIGCLKTLIKYSWEGNEISLVISGNPKGRKEKDSMSYSELKIDHVYFTERFDESTVTQENVNTLGSIIKKTKPSLVILPFDKTKNKKRAVLAHSALLACRGIKNILMYETTKNENFSPNVFFTFEKESLNGLTEDRKLQINSTVKEIRKSIQKFHSSNIRIEKNTEAFESKRVLLLDISEIA
ncbi:MAG: hypothetical protein KGI25_00150 [Thaumarchaeota archaeon]|nr:hypothetical protein [Nitrososphaerota archaeon]